VVDDAQGVITAVRTTTGRINESHELTELIDQHQTNTQIAAETIVADCKYGTIVNYIGCQKRKLRTRMADLLASSPGSGRRDKIYPESMFRYQQQSDTFLCPAGQVMKPRRLHSVRLTWEYVAKRGVCLSRRLRKFCTRSRTGANNAPPSGPKAFGPSSPTSQYQAGETGSEAPAASDRTQLCRRF
jgi:hypothetical protein